MFQTKWVKRLKDDNAEILRHFVTITYFWYNFSSLCSWFSLIGWKKDGDKEIKNFRGNFLELQLLFFKNKNKTNANIERNKLISFFFHLIWIKIATATQSKEI